MKNELSTIYKENWNALIKGSKGRGRTDRIYPRKNSKKEKNTAIPSNKRAIKETSTSKSVTLWIYVHLRCPESPICDTSYTDNVSRMFKL